MAKIKLDLHDIFNRGQEVEAELRRVIEEAVGKRISLTSVFYES